MRPVTTIELCAVFFALVEGIVDSEAVTGCRRKLFMIKNGVWSRQPLAASYD